MAQKKLQRFRGFATGCQAKGGHMGTDSCAASQQIAMISFFGLNLLHADCLVAALKALTTLEMCFTMWLVDLQANQSSLMMSTVL